MDIMKIAGLIDISPLIWLERTLHWCHYAPTAPDTTPTYSSNKIDPFIITECPDIYFVGNMDKYDTKIYTGKFISLYYYLYYYIFIFLLYTYFYVCHKKITLIK